MSTLNDSKLSKVSHEKGLGATITNDLKLSKHCSDVKNSNKLVGFIERTFEYESEKNLSLHYLMDLYALIYNIAFSSDHHTITKKNIKKLERIQRKNT